jgi:hypothetical protein
MSTSDKRVLLSCVAESLRSVHSIVDFLGAVSVGTKLATEMLDDVESKLLDVVAVLDRDGKP